VTATLLLLAVFALAEALWEHHLRGEEVTR
jgi:hypothetical protein